jgi:hypothetical protein
MAATAAACGGTHDPIAELVGPSIRVSSVALTPVLDVSQLPDPAMADRIAIDEITIRVADVRLLGADPRIPSGGWPLISAPEEVGGSGAFGFPERFASDDLAVYVHLDDSQAAPSVVVKGRFLSVPTARARAKARAASADAASPGPDGEPIKPTAPGGLPGPDGVPIKTLAAPAAHGTLVLGTQNLSAPGAAVAFELEASDGADMALEFGASGQLDARVGIPALRWLTPAALNSLEAALVAQRTSVVVIAPAAGGEYRLLRN